LQFRAGTGVVLAAKRPEKRQFPSAHEYEGEAALRWRRAQLSFSASIIWRRSPVQARVGVFIFKEVDAHLLNLRKSRVLRVISSGM